MTPTVYGERSVSNKFAPRSQISAERRTPGEELYMENLH